MHRDVSRKIRSATILLLASMALAALTACGGGSTGDSSQPPVPISTNDPVSTPISNPAGYLGTMLEELKASGFVARAIEQHQLRGVVVAPIITYLVRNQALSQRGD